MLHLLVRLMLVSALAQFGMKLADLENCHSRECLQTVEVWSRDVLKIDWKPMIVFPQEAKRFRKEDSI